MIINLTDVENAPVKTNAAGQPYVSIRKGNQRVVIVLSRTGEIHPSRVTVGPAPYFTTSIKRSGHYCERLDNPSATCRECEAS